MAGTETQVPQGSIYLTKYDGWGERVQYPVGDRDTGLQCGRIACRESQGDWVGHVYSVIPFTTLPGSFSGRKAAAEAVWCDFRDKRSAKEA